MLLRLNAYLNSIEKRNFFRFGAWSAVLIIVTFIIFDAVHTLNRVKLANRNETLHRDYCARFKWAPLVTREGVRWCYDDLGVLHHYYSEIKP